MLTQTGSDRGFDDVSGQLEEYLAGSRTLFELPLGPRGTVLQLRVWELIAQIPYGHPATGTWPGGWAP